MTRRFPGVHLVFTRVVSVIPAEWSSPGEDQEVLLFPRGRAVEKSPGVPLVFSWCSPGEVQVLQKSWFSLDFPGVPLGFAWCSPGVLLGITRETPGEHQPGWKSKVGACFFSSAPPGVYQDFPRGRPSFLLFPWCLPGKPQDSMTFHDSEIRDFCPTGIWSGWQHLVFTWCLPGVHQGKGSFLADW